MVEICQSVNEQTDEPPCNGSENIVWIPIAWMRNPCRGMPHDQSSCRPTSHHQVSARDGDDWYDDGHREVGGEDRGLSLRSRMTASFIMVENVEKPPRKPVASRKCTSPEIANFMDKAATIPARRPAMTLMMNVDREMPYARSL